MDFKETRLCKVISVVVLFFFTWSYAGGRDLAFAAGNPKAPRTKQQTTAQPSAKSAAARLNDLMDALDDTLKDDTLNPKEAKRQIKNHRDAIRALDSEMRDELAATGKRLKDKKMPAEIQARHARFVEHYESNMAQMMADVDDLIGSRDADFDAKRTKARNHMEQSRPKPKHPTLDPNKLPHRAAEPTTKQPRTNKADFGTQSAAINPLTATPILIAANGDLAGLLDGGESFVVAAADAPTSADLAQTIEVQFTTAIANKAAELGHDPVRIYEWVRNNVEFAPTYGSIQGADYCMQTMQCNAFDTASLLIALLRASDVPARYAYGTVEMPIDRFMNWVGGFTNATAALDFAASGGIPTKGLREGGTITRAQLEHIWVEAWVSMEPSMGAVQSATGKRWTQLDASYKQYTYTDGVDIASVVPFDAGALVGDLVSSATINEAEGWVTGVDSSLINTAMSDYRAQVEQYFATQMPDATVGDVLGTKTIVKQERGIFMGTLPYRLRVLGERMSALPDAQRHKLTFSVTGGDLYTNASPLTITYALPQLAGKKVTLSYSPATQADEDVINSYLPAPHADGTPIDPSELPTSLPAYLINLKPELRVEGAVVATGGAVMMGTTEDMVMTFNDPAHGSDVIRNIILAGDYWGVFVGTSGISKQHLLKQISKLEKTKSMLQQQSYTNISKDDLLGDILYVTASIYYSKFAMLDYLAAMKLKASVVQLPSEAVFKYKTKTELSFGIPILSTSNTLSMDVDRLISSVMAYDGNRETNKLAIYQSGIESSILEHEIPQELFSTEQYKRSWISTIKVLEMAYQQGIKVYTITGSNIDNILPSLSISLEDKNVISNAIRAGLIVIVPQRDMNLNRWSGTGYIIYDLKTGAGSYLISGGDNGSDEERQEAIDDYNFYNYWLGVAQLTATIFLSIAAAGFLAFVFIPFLFILPEVIAGISTAAAVVSELILNASIAIYSLVQSYAISSFLLLLLGSIKYCLDMLPPSGIDDTTMMCSAIVATITLLAGGL